MKTKKSEVNISNTISTFVAACTAMARNAAESANALWLLCLWAMDLSATLAEVKTALRAGKEWRKGERAPGEKQSEILKRIGDSPLFLSICRPVLRSSGLKFKNPDQLKRFVLACIEQVEGKKNQPYPDEIRAALTKGDVEFTVLSGEPGLTFPSTKVNARYKKYWAAQTDHTAEQPAGSKTEEAMLLKLCYQYYGSITLAVEAMQEAISREE